MPNSGAAAGTIRPVLENPYLGKTVHFRRRALRMRLDLAKTCGERNLALGGEYLVSEDEDDVLQEVVANRVKGPLVDVCGEIDSSDFGAHSSAETTNGFDLHVSVPIPEACDVMPVRTRAPTVRQP